MCDKICAVSKRLMPISSAYSKREAASSGGVSVKASWSVPKQSRLTTRPVLPNGTCGACTICLRCMQIDSPASDETPGKVETVYHLVGGITRTEAPGSIFHFPSRARPLYSRHRLWYHTSVSTITVARSIAIPSIAIAPAIAMRSVTWLPATYTTQSFWNTTTPATRRGASA